MKSFLKIFGALFGIVATIMLVIYLIRLANNNNTFIGFTDLFSYISEIDLMKPFNDFIEEITNTFNGFSALSNTTFGSEWDAIMSFFQNFWNLIMLPIKAIYYLIVWLLTLLDTIVNFFDYVINYKGTYI